MSLNIDAVQTDDREYYIRSSDALVQKLKDTEWSLFGANLTRDVITFTGYACTRTYVYM